MRDYNSIRKALRNLQETPDEKLLDRVRDFFDLSKTDKLGFPEIIQSINTTNTAINKIINIIKPPQTTETDSTKVRQQTIFYLDRNNFLVNDEEEFKIAGNFLHAVASNTKNFHINDTRGFIYFNSYFSIKFDDDSTWHLLEYNRTYERRFNKFRIKKIDVPPIGGHQYLCIAISNTDPMIRKTNFPFATTFGAWGDIQNTFETPVRVDHNSGRAYTLLDDISAGSITNLENAAIGSNIKNKAFKNYDLQWTQSVINTIIGVNNCTPLPPIFLPYQRLGAITISGDIMREYRFQWSPSMNEITRVHMFANFTHTILFPEPYIVSPSLNQVICTCMGGAGNGWITCHYHNES